MIKNRNSKKDSQKKNDYVMVLHGIAKTATHTQRLANYIGANGFEVFNIEYPSTKLTIKELTDYIYESISRIGIQNESIHFVGYSMGGLLVRAVIDKYHFKNLGRVVQIAPPNQGSELVDYLKNSRFYNFFYKIICGPAGQELDTRNKFIKQLMGKVNYELGIVACKINYKIPIISSVMPQVHDGRVAVESTKADGMKDHVILTASHLAAPNNKEVQEQTVFFLKNGRFKH